MAGDDPRFEACDLAGLTLDPDKARASIAGFRVKPVIVALDALPGLADVIVECIPAAHFRAAAEPALRAGRTFMPLSVGALLDNFDLIDLARENAGRIIVPSGAIQIKREIGPPLQ